MENAIAKEEARLEEVAVAFMAEENNADAEAGGGEGSSGMQGGGRRSSSRLTGEAGGRPSSSAVGSSSGDEFTLRSLLVGSVVGGFLSLMNIYMGFKLTIWQPVGLPATIIGFAVMRVACSHLGPWFPSSVFGSPFGYKENVVLQTAAVAAAEMASASGVCSTLFAATCRYQHYKYQENSSNNGGGNDDDDDGSGGSVPFGECESASGVNDDGSSCECLAPFGFKQVLAYCYACLGEELLFGQRS